MAVADDSGGTVDASRDHSVASASSSLPLPPEEAEAPSCHLVVGCRVEKGLASAVGCIVCV